MKEYFEKLIINKIDYDDIKLKCEVNTPNLEPVDISFIITVKNRVEFGPAMYKSFLKAKNNTNLNISYTIVELSPNSEHKEFCLKNKINYIWYKTDTNEMFNKCLGLNIGAIFFNKAKAFIFHDIDCLIQSDFFTKLKTNIDDKNALAIQCFHGRRVLYLNQYLTNLAINNTLNIDTLKLGLDGISLPNLIGAPGGSIYVDKEIFFKVGGYDPELFAGNAPEDIFFWVKVELFTKMYLSDNPEIDIFHMNHTPTAGTNPYIHAMLKTHNMFKTLSNEDKLDVVKFKAKTIEGYYYE
jgi:predicted glycosyltransferase involved in capsule biosynthesis